jgi:acetamidase/formamidase
MKLLGEKMILRTIKLTAAAGLLLLSQMCLAFDLCGNWIAEIATGGEPDYKRVSLRCEGSKVAGEWGDSKIDGSFNGSKLDVTLTDADGRPAGSLTGTLSGESISGTGIFIGGRGGRGRSGMAFGGGFVDGSSGPVAWTLTRAAVPPASPKSYDFAPTDLYATYSGGLKPALRIFAGDTVRTWTADAGGVDAKGVRHRGGDSAVGPFYVEGALPGDTLVVHLLKIRTNRSSARQGTRINAHAVTAAYLVGAKYDPAFSGEWTLSPDIGVATLTHPTERMKGYSVPLKPMLGCISVAPPGEEQYRGGDLGPFGGNMDYNDNVEGTTLYFPVFHLGALFGIGDGHAAMGDGEVTGSALETSMDVDFSVDVIKGDASAQPRAETKDYLIAFGVSGSVPESIQIATSQLATWIKKDYKLNDNEVAILFGATLKYDITELVDAKYNVAAKIPKSILASMK